MSNSDAIGLQIEKLILYGLQKELIWEGDYFIVRNALFELFGVSHPSTERVSKRFNEIKLADVLDDIVETGVKLGLTGGSAYERDMFGTKVMGFLTPRGSEVQRTFTGLMEKSPKDATDYYFALSKNTGYIKEGSSIAWTADTEFGALELTINTAKPEKDPKKIAAEKNKSLYGVYPKCALCPQTAGFGGSDRIPARNNHRIIPLKRLGDINRNWYFQYSPYQYYNEHCIVLYQNHIPMKIDERTFVTLFDFIDMFPHYFIGSNADLPIVGGSILTHEHYQGGRHRFPMEKAPVVRTFTSNGLSGVTADIIRWPLSTVRLRGDDRNALTTAASHLMNVWKSYQDAEIVPFTDETAEVKKGTKTVTEYVSVPHNTVTPILRKPIDGKGYEFDIVLRNNLTNDKYPLGIYHPHEDVWHIKKENIGLIEVMGLAVLPPRLLPETASIAEILAGKASVSDELYAQKPELLQHKEWINFLTGKYGVNNTEQKSREIIQEEIGIKFARVLSDCGVFKPDDNGLERFYAFMESAGWK